MRRMDIRWALGLVASLGVASCGGDSSASDSGSTDTTSDDDEDTGDTDGSGGADTTGASTGGSGEDDTGDAGTTGAGTTGTGTTGTSTGGSSDTGGAGLAVDDRYETVQDTTLTVAAAAGLLANDPGAVAVSSSDSTSVHGGTVTVDADGGFEYAPPSGHWRTDRFTYEADDGAGGTDSATVTIMVTPTLAPVARIEGESSGGFAVHGAAAGDRAGFSVAGVGDVNGDGLDDLVVGAPFANFAAGRAYVVFGRAGSTAIDLFDVENGTAGFVIEGQAMSTAGWIVGGGGDVNGDGIGDVVVGMPYDSTNGPVTGGAFVVFGKTSGTPVRLSDVGAGTGGFMIESEGMYTYAGMGIEIAGDVNADGKDDVVIGSKAAPDQDGFPQGRAYVVFGKTDGGMVRLSTVAAGVPSSGGFRIEGVEYGMGEPDGAGFSVAAAGDVNQDGRADVIIGAPGDGAANTSAGRAYVVFGRSATAPVLLADVASGAGGGFAIQGTDVGEGLGFDVDGGQDVNGDGRVDLVVGAPGWVGPGGTAGWGRVAVVFGKDDPGLVDLGTLGMDGFVIEGSGENQNLGVSVALTGDLDDDGTPDIAVGEWLTLDGGRGHVVYGKASVTAVDLADVSQGIGGFSLQAASADDLLGHSVAAGGDVDGDGYADLLIGASLADPMGMDSGTVYVVCGDDFN